MRRYVQGAAGLVFSLILGVLLVFWAVKDTRPSGHGVFLILYGVLAASALIWLVAEILRRRESRRRRTGDEPQPSGRVGAAVAFEGEGTQGNVVNVDEVTGYPRVVEARGGAKENIVNSRLFQRTVPRPVRRWLSSLRRWLAKLIRRGDG